MTNLILAYPNRTDEATLSGGSWQATLPLTNLQNRIQAVVARSTDATTGSTQFSIDIGKPRTIDLLALCGHNLSLDATLQVVASELSDFSVLLYDSGATTVWPALFSSESLEWEDGNWWSGQISEELRATYPANVIRRFTQIAARYWKVLISDTGNADGFIQLGRLFISPVWSPVVNYDYGAGISWETDTTAERSLGGQDYFDRRAGRRVFRCQLSWLSEKEAYENAWEFQRTLGTDGEVFVMADPDNVLHETRLSYLGRLRQLSPIEHPYFSYHRTAVEVAELL